MFSHPPQILPQTWQLIRMKRQHQPEIAKLVSYLQHARQQMFPFLATTSLPEDLCNFQQHYIEQALSSFWLLKTPQKIIATIGFRAYDQRFGHLLLPQHKVVEVVRLYVEPEFRRRGLAKLLLQHLKLQAQLMGVDCLYLHTHPCLPGAVEFWQAQGFKWLCQDLDDPLWQTIHMAYPLKEASCSPNTSTELCPTNSSD
jgi:N-acetylglutamate synthase-like GNAT family acetyltransferase